MQSVIFDEEETIDDLDDDDSFSSGFNIDKLSIPRRPSMIPSSPVYY